jgi:hypothetical protein
VKRSHAGPLNDLHCQPLLNARFPTPLPSSSRSDFPALRVLPRSAGHQPAIIDRHPLQPRKRHKRTQ